jgi:hypothetical protein
MYENGTMRLETLLRREVGWIKENDGEVNLTKTYCRYFLKYNRILPKPQ